jgi:hypothetical protein
MSGCAAGVHGVPREDFRAKKRRPLQAVPVMARAKSPVR